MLQFVCHGCSSPPHTHTHLRDVSCLSSTLGGAAAPQTFSSLNTVVALFVGETATDSLEGRRCSVVKADSSYFPGKEAPVSEFLNGVIRECSFFAVYFFLLFFSSHFHSDQGIYTAPPLHPSNPLPPAGRGGLVRRRKCSCDIGDGQSRMLTFYLLRREGQLRSWRVKLLHLLTTAG